MDPRIARTRRSLRDALFSLARERPLESISVSDIAERAGVNRSTYYQHYSDKDTLLADALDAVIDDALGGLGTGHLDIVSGAGVLRSYLAHVEEHADLYRVLLGESGSATIQVRMSNRLRALLSEAFEGDHKPPLPDLGALPTEITAAALAGSALATIRVWLDLTSRPDVETATRWIWTVLRVAEPLPDA